MKVRQWNLGRGQKATREAERSSNMERVDALLVQEPYQVKGVIPTNTGRWFYCAHGQEVWAAVAIFNEEWEAVLERERSNQYVVCVKVRLNGWKGRLLSVYCRFSLDIGQMLNKVEGILLAAGGRGVMVGADVNARSPL